MRKNLRPIASLLLAIGLLVIGNGLLITLLPLRGHGEGFGALSLGIIASAYYVGFGSGCLVGPYLILRAGHIRAFAATVAVAAAVTLAYGLVPNEFAWMFFRLITGFCLAGFYLVIESWLNDGVTNDSRGLVMSTYVMVNFAALTVGQLLITVYPIDRGGDFMIAAMLSSIAIVPVALTRSAQPAPITIVSFRPRQLYDAAPVALIGAFMIGIANGAFWGLAPLSAADSGLNVNGVALFMTVAVAAGALAQWPLGRLSDRVDRRRMLSVLLVAAAATGMVLWLLAATLRELLGFGLLFGALTFPGYSLAAAHGYDKTPASDMVPTAATILLVNSLGSVIGPLGAAGVMSAVGPRGLYLFIALIQAALAVYVVYRIRVQAPLPARDKTGFDLATTAQVGTIVTTEAIDPADPSLAVPENYAPPTDPGATADPGADADQHGNAP
ncbi:MAG: MFS transporter [Stellaceae bacterium]